MRKSHVLHFDFPVHTRSPFQSHGELYEKLIDQRFMDVAQRSAIVPLSIRILESDERIENTIRELALSHEDIPQEQRGWLFHSRKIQAQELRLFRLRTSCMQAIYWHLTHTLRQAGYGRGLERIAVQEHGAFRLVREREVLGLAKSAEKAKDFWLDVFPSKDLMLVSKEPTHTVRCLIGGVERKGLRL